MGGNSDKYFQTRLGQTAGYGYAPNAAWPNTFMGTAFDLANPPGTKCVSGCIHIFNKQAAAHRLALAARGVVYNQTGLVFSGPRATGVARAAAGATVVVQYAASPGLEGGGLKMRGQYGFDVCYGAGCNASATGGSNSAGADWQYANITKVDAVRRTVVVKGPPAYSDKSIAAVR